jgi:primosomal protein N' (replication factor Y)
MERTVPEPNDAQQGQLWTEQVAEKVGPVAGVAPVAALDKLYSYSIPAEFADRVRPGMRVEVPFGRKGTRRLGFCVSVSQENWTTTLKPLLAVMDHEPLLSPRLLELGKWLSEYYCAPLGRALEAMVPAAVRRQSGFRRVRRLRLTAAGERAVVVGSAVRTMSEVGPHSGPYGVGTGEATPPAPPLSRGGEEAVACGGEAAAPQSAIRIPRLTAKRMAVLARLQRAGGAVEIEELRREGLASAGAIKVLREAGLIAEDITKEPPAAPQFDRPAEDPRFELNPDQAAAIGRIESWLDPPTFRVGLLFGVSGSGKTEVYVRCIRRVIDAGRQAILLVPEIALTAQTTHRLAARFHDVVVLHSGLTDSQRSLIWSEIARGKKKVIIGTRSAVFAPCPNLGLIVVDEEQEPSFKNQQSPRFHTRDVAIKRAQLESVPIVLGSATPSLETWANCSRLPHYELLRLPRRVAGLPLPRVDVVDMQVEHRARKGIHLMSRLMEQLLGETLQRGEQAVLLLNRRGYASFLFCPSCEQRIVCPNCQTNMIFHKTTGMAQCHYCRAHFPVPSRCPNENCRHTLVRFGMGTQRVEEELASKFPKARVRRVDSDTMERAAQYEEIVTAFERREIDVLVGTQMIAKGLDFPFVSFVGVISADTALSIPDFRAAERTFQLVTQVAGRAGRAQAAGRVVVQTFVAEVHALKHAVTHDYESFAAAELLTRQKLRLPPYGRLVRVVLADGRESRVRTAADAMAAYAREYARARRIPIDCWGPNVCPLGRIRNLYRYEVLLRADSASVLHAAMQQLRHDPAFLPKVRQCIIDVDPISLL